MTLTRTRTHSGSSRLPTWIAACAVLMAAAAVLADDKSEKAKAAEKDVYRQIEEAVLAGDLTKEEALAKLKALKQQGDAKVNAAKQGYDKDAVAHLESIWGNLQALVASGKMSQDQANAAMGMIKDAVGVAKNATKKTPTAPVADDVHQQIEAAVLAGKITKEEARAKLKALQQQNAPEQPARSAEKKHSFHTEPPKEDTEAYLKKVWTELQEAVAAGKLTKDDAVAKMSAIKKAKSGE
jgi:polyhydroxyalkanoate synthesis regulator phasin